MTGSQTVPVSPRVICICSGRPSRFMLRPMEPTPAPRALVVAAFASISVIWGSTYLAIRIALVDFPPFVIGAFRFLVAGGLLSCYARLRGHKWPSSAEWAGSALVGGLFFV